LTETDVPAVTVFANQVAITLENARLHERAQHEIAESDWTNAEGWAAVRAQTEQRRAGQKSVYELGILRPDGQQRRLLVTSQPCFDHEGQFTGMFGIFRDITDRVRAEEALRESEERFRTLTGAAQDAIIAIDPEGCISYWNTAAVRMFGYTEQEEIGKDVHALLAPEEYHAAFQRGFAAFGSGGQGRTIGRTLAVFLVHASICHVYHPFEDDSGLD
jgi:PAS domain-containing protein